MRPRVFVSSVVKGFEEYREAARRGIIQAGGEPVLVNEDFPALDTSSRNACLDGVVSCDIYIVVVGERGGWTAPSGKLVVEEEYDQARKGKKRILAFIQNVDRDDDANRFVAALSDYTDGLFRRSFETVGELEAQVANALTSIVNHSIVDRIQPIKIQEKLNERFEIPSASRLRVVIAPERDEEVIDVVRLDSMEFRRQLLELGHAREVDLFSYEHAKSTEVQIDSFVIEQAEAAGRASCNSFVRLEISSCGLVSIDTNVTGRVARGSLHGFGEGFVIVETDVVQCLQSSFAFVNAMYENLDRYKRQQRFLYNAALGEISYRRLVAEYRERDSMSFGNNEKGIVPAFDRPRLISREDLASADAEITSIITMLRRRLKG